MEDILEKAYRQQLAVDALIVECALQEAINNFEIGKNSYSATFIRGLADKIRNQ
jgi:hypothetical protein